MTVRWRNDDGKNKSKSVQEISEETSEWFSEQFRNENNFKKD